MSFDLDDTLYDNHPFIVEAEKQLFDFIYSRWPALQDIGKKSWIAFRREAIQEDGLLRHDMIALRRVVLRKLFASIGLQGSQLEDAVQQSYDVFYFHRSNFQVEVRFIQVLKKLTEKLPVIAITNGNVDIERVGLAGCFHKVYHASTEQRSKPYRDMFDRAAAWSGIAPQNMLHVGDNLEKDVFGALNAGFMTCWYAENRDMQLSKEKAQQLPHIQLDGFDELITLS